MKKYLFLSLCWFVSANSSFAQLGRNDDFLPNYPTLQESLKPIQSPVNEALTISTPLPSKIRAMAEWEELQGLAIAWQGATSHKVILAEIVRAARLECNVMILCNDSTTLKSCKTALQNAKVEVSSNVSFLIKPTDSIWMRDYGGNPVYSNDVDTLGMVDWIYNRNRPSDDASPSAVANFAKIPLYQTIKKPEDLVHTGGNFMSDGLGTGFSSELIFDENGPKPIVPTSQKTEKQIDSIMFKYMGINRYIKMTILPYDVIHHIDMHMKLLDEETLLFSEYPKDIADGPQIEANLQYILTNYKTPFGNPYKIIRIPSPPDENNLYPNKNGTGKYRTYANMTFVNKTVLVPFYEQKYDTTAARVLKDALPGYNIVGINCNGIIGSLGAIHCITKELGVAEPLWITHEKKNNFPLYKGENIPVSAQIKHIKGIKNATIWYKTSDDKDFKALTLNNKVANTNQWQAEFNNLPNNSIIQYYIEAEAKNGKKITRPITAPQGFYSFVLGKKVLGVENALVENVKIYPNPARAITCIEFQNPQTANLSIELFDVLGQKILTIQKGEVQEGTNRFFFDASTLSKGIYFAKINATNGELVKKIVVE
jgi:agmatine deiminase